MPEEEQGEPNYRWRMIALGILVAALVVCIIRELILRGHTISNVTH